MPDRPSPRRPLWRGTALTLGALALGAALLHPAAQAETPATPAAAHKVEDPYTTLYDDMAQRHVAQALTACTALKDGLAAGATGPLADTETRRAAFTALATGWGQVQASYVLGGYDTAAMDYPLMMDAFHSGKEDIPAAIARLSTGTDAPDKALYKTSYRTLTALDATLFGGDFSPRRAELGTAMTESLCARLGQIRDGYAAARGDFMADPDTARALLVNTLIEQVYKTRDWRLGEVAGLTRKTAGKPDRARQQYPFSGASWAVIGGNLEVFAQMLAEDTQPNIATIGRIRSAEAGVAAAQTALAEARAAYAAAPEPFAPEASADLFATLGRLQDAIAQQMVPHMAVPATLIDADGD